MTNSFELRKQRDSALAYIKEHLVECCSELLEWHRTGILCEGKMRIAATMCHNWMGASRDSLTFVERAVERSALQAVVDASKPKEPPACAETGLANMVTFDEVQSGGWYYDIIPKSESRITLRYLPSSEHEVVLFKEMGDGTSGVLEYAKKVSFTINFFTGEVKLEVPAKCKLYVCYRRN